jgi:hypothetical protein
MYNDCYSGPYIVQTVPYTEQLAPQVAKVLRYWRDNAMKYNGYGGATRYPERYSGVALILEVYAQAITNYRYAIGDAVTCQYIDMALTLEYADFLLNEGWRVRLELPEDTTYKVGSTTIKPKALRDALDIIAKEVGYWYGVAYAYAQDKPAPLPNMWVNRSI